MTKERYEKSVDVLLDAYNKGALFHGNCNACAVGNLCGGRMEWSMIIPQTAKNGESICRAERVLKLKRELVIEYRTEGRNSIRHSGLSRLELTTIETAFEMSVIDTDEGRDYWREGENQKQGQFIGLSAVLKVMVGMVEEEVPHKENMERLETVYENVKTT